MRICYIKLCVEKAIRIADDVAQLESHMGLHDSRGFYKTHGNQIICLLQGSFQHKCFPEKHCLSCCAKPLFLVHPLTRVQGAAGYHINTPPTNCVACEVMKKEKGQGTTLEIHEAIMRRNSTLCILQSVHAVWQVLHFCQYHSSELISLSSCKIWEASSSQEILDFFFYLFILGWFRTKPL